MRRGEVFWAEHPEWGRRPAGVMTRDEAIGVLNEVLVVLATTTIRDLPTEGPARTRGRDAKECVLNLDHVDTATNSFIGDRITTQSAEKLHAVCRALDVATGCS